MDLNFNNIIKTFRIEKNITQKKLCHGLCSISMLSHIEKGDRFPDYALRMRLFKRLGLGSGRLIHFLSPNEYELWTLKKEIAKKICCNDTDNMTNLMQRLEDTIPSGDVISLQFLYDLQALHHIQDHQFEDALSIYDDLINLSMKGISDETLSDYAIAPVEYYYLLMWLKCKWNISSENNRRINSSYQKILAHIDSSYMDSATKAEIYPLAAIEYINFRLSNIDFSPSSVIPLIAQATSLLQKASKTYFLKELLEMTILVSKEMMPNETSLHQTKDMLSALNKLHSQSNIDNSNTLSPFYFYSDENCQDISVVIKERRLLLEMTQNDLSDGICSAKTLRRIEQGNVLGHTFNLSLLLEKMNIFDSHQYDDCFSDNWNIISLSHKLRTALQNNDIVVQQEVYYELKDSIDNDHLLNRQTLERSNAIIQYNAKAITGKECIDKLISALTLTIPLDIVRNYKKGYLTEGEVECIYAIATIVEAENLELNWIYTSLENIVNNSNSIRPSFKAAILRLIGNIYSNKNDYKNSEKFARNALETELKCHRIQFAYITLYDLTWNQAQKSPNPFNPYISDNLYTCLTLAKYYSNESHAAFFDSRLKLIQKKDPSWME